MCFVCFVLELCFLVHEHHHLLSLLHVGHREVLQVVQVQNSGWLLLLLDGGVFGFQVLLQLLELLKVQNGLLWLLWPGNSLSSLWHSDALDFDVLDWSLGGFGDSRGDGEKDVSKSHICVSAAIATRGIISPM